MQLTMAIGLLPPLISSSSFLPSNPCKLYWYTIEFGMVDEDGAPRAYGAGMLSARQELKHCITDAPKRHDLDIEEAIATTYPDTGLQPHYFVARSMEDMRRKLL